MTNDAARPADTRMMTIVHGALRRDLERATTALRASPPPPDPQRAAIARHLDWLMAFLRAHHRSEDEGLYPAVRSKRPQADAVLDEMHEDHEQVAAAIDTLEAAARRYGASDGAPTREALAAAIDDLDEVLLPHLQREEDEVMPLVSQTLTAAEWNAIEQEHNLQGKTMRELAKEGHWLIDDASPVDRATVVGVVPPVSRFVLIHGFARSYRRGRDACWGPTTPPRRVQKHGRSAVVVPADPDAVWDVVLDVTRVGEWSHECCECTFLDGATRTEPGARFRGRNRRGAIRWGRVCEVVSTDDRELVWRTVPTALYPDSTVWRISVTAIDSGTQIEQRFDVVRAPKLLDFIYAAMIPAHRDRGDALTDDLRRLGELATAPRPER